MLYLIIDTSELDLTYPGVKESLEIDLKRIEMLNHSEKPNGANALRISARNGSYTDAIIYSMRYGIVSGIEEDEFLPLGALKEYPHEYLPFLDRSPIRFTMT